jgi:hypothetical protein
MNPLTMDDVIPFQEYAERRPEFWESHRQYRNRYRRVAIGPKFVLLFENRQTLWFRVQEILRIARVQEPELVQMELDWLNQLLPGRDQLQAAWVLDFADLDQPANERKFWSDLVGDDVQLHVSELSVPARLVTCRPADRVAGTAGWLEFILSTEERELFADFQNPVHLEVTYMDYCHTSGTLSDEVRQSLLEDLELSDRSHAA